MCPAKLNHLTGDNVRQNIASQEDFNVIDEWRGAHRAVLNTFQAILRNRTKNKNIIVGQRHKRKKTIFNKLNRFQDMQLVRMDDIAGCRLIFDNIEELYQFRTQIHKARFKHKVRNDIDRYDYIKTPKSTGYRGIHDIYIYDVNSEQGAPYKGLMVELQYRTKVQHAWATTVEVIGFITENQPKFQQGDKRYEQIMAIASEILARVYEDKNGAFPDVDNRTIVEAFVNLDSELKLLQTLKGLNKSSTEITDNKNVILIFNDKGGLEVRTYKDATSALKELFKLEKEKPTKDIVLVIPGGKWFAKREHNLTL